MTSARAVRPHWAATSNSAILAPSSASLTTRVATGTAQNVSPRLATAGALERAAAGALQPRRLYGSSTAGGAGAGQPQGLLPPAVRGRLARSARAGGRSSPIGREDRLLRRATQLVADLAVSSSPALRGSGRRNRARRGTLDLVAQEVLLAGQAFEPALPR